MIRSSKLTILYLITCICLFNIAIGQDLYPNTSSAHEYDNECAENRAEALEMGRQCSRRCKRNIPCENIRKQCLCDGLCGLSCTRPDLICPDLPKIRNGHFLQPKRNLFGTKVTYRCDPGYYLYGSRERICQGDEEWSDVPAECNHEPLCRTPIQVSHARNPIEGTYQLNDRVEYSCYPGYQSKGSSEASCRLIEENHTFWVWKDAPFRCIPKSCGDPGHIENGKRVGESMIIASSVQYICNDGYEMMGPNRRFCQSDGQWSGQAPKCEPVTCKPTDHLDNGMINYAYPLIFNSTVEYSCDHGFRLIGSPRRKCGPERRLLGEIPSCVEIDCGQLGQLYNGFVRGYSNRMGDRKEFICKEGMKFVGEQDESICLETGNWSNPLPQCLAPCIVPPINKAKAIYAIQSSEINDNTRPSGVIVVPGTYVSHEIRLDFSCEPDYEPDEQINNQDLIEAPICNNGTWSSIPNCKPASCKFGPPSPKNGRISMFSIEHGSKGYVRCMDGFKLAGNAITTCVKGNWTNINSTCIEVYCGFPGVIEKGRVLLVGLTGMYEYKPYIKRIPNNRQIAYECDSGYRASEGAPSGATCLEGQWRPEGTPTCTKE